MLTKIRRLRKNSRESDDERGFVRESADERGFVYTGMEIPWSKGELLFGGSIRESAVGSKLFLGWWNSVGR